MQSLQISLNFLESSIVKYLAVKSLQYSGIASRKTTDVLHLCKLEQTCLPSAANACTWNSSAQKNVSFLHRRRSHQVYLKTRAYTQTAIMLPKDFSFNDYDIIGFDLDCTLLRYNLQEMIPLQYDILKRFLVEQRQYPPCLLELSLDYDFLQKGLVLDAENGNILKLGSKAQILRASHGTRRLTDTEIMQIYGAERKWNISRQFFENPMSTWNGPLSEKLRTLLDYFDMIVSLVFAQVVDVLDAKNGGEAATCYQVWPDVLQGLYFMYTREHFANGTGGYFSALRAEPERYLLRTSERVIAWIKELRAAGKAVYLLTGSNADFANHTASYALGKDWQQLFDAVVCFAKKPHYFTQQRPYYRVENLTEVAGSELSLTEPLVPNKIYSQGNWIQLRATLAKKLNKDANKVRALYVGDNLIQDVYTPVKHHDLDSVAVCEEMLADDAETSDYAFHKVVSSAFWGSYFSLNNESTLWATYIAEYAHLCVPLIDNVVEHPLSYRFCFEASALRYIPKAPLSLRED